MDDISRVFEYFPNDDVAVVGSVLRDPERARDIDVLVPASVDFPALAERLGVGYNGWDLADGSHLRRANFRIPNIDKNVQLLQNRLVTAFEEWPHAVRLRDGRILNPDKHFMKNEKDPTHVGWKRKSSRRVADIYKDY
jgi:hypothetical protein